jgi:hypothetical protein
MASVLQDTGAGGLKGPVLANIDLGGLFLNFYFKKG